MPIVAVSDSDLRFDGFRFRGLNGVDDSNHEDSARHLSFLNGIEQSDGVGDFLAGFEEVLNVEGVPYERVNFEMDINTGELMGAGAGGTVYEVADGLVQVWSNGNAVGFFTGDRWEDGHWTGY